MSDMLKRGKCQIPQSPVSLLGLFFICTVLPCVFLLQNGLPIARDRYWNLIWVHFWTNSVLNGNLYPRWFDEAFGGLGTPTFAIYPPLFRIFCLPFAALHMSPSQTVVCGLVTVILFHNLGWFILIRNLKANQLSYHYRLFAKIITSVVAFLNPLFWEDLIKRGGYSEITAMAIIPWIFFCYDRISNTKSYSLQHQLWLGCCFVLLGLCHLPSLMIVSFLFFSHVFFLKNMQIVFRFIKDTLGALFAACLLVSFLLVPAFFDSSKLIFTPSTIEQYGLLSSFYYVSKGIVTPNIGLSLEQSMLFGIVTLTILTISWRRFDFESSSSSSRDDHPHNFSLLRLAMTSLLISVLMVTDFGVLATLIFPPLLSIQYAWRFILIGNEAIPLLVFAILISQSEKIFSRVITGIYITLTMLMLSHWFAQFDPLFDRELERTLDALLVDETTTVTQSVKTDLCSPDLTVLVQRYNLISNLKGQPQGTDGLLDWSFKQRFLREERPASAPAQSNESGITTFTEDYGWYRPISEFEEIVCAVGYTGGVFRGRNSNKLIFVDWPQYLPSTVNIDLWQRTISPYALIPPRDFQDFEWNNQTPVISNSIPKLPHIDNYREGPGVRSFHVVIAETSSVILRLLYHPGWQAYAQGAEHKSNLAIGHIDDGRITLDLPPGDYTVTLKYEGTKAEQWGTKVSFFSGLVILMLIAIHYTRQKKFREMRGLPV